MGTVVVLSVCLAEARAFLARAAMLEKPLDTRVCGQTPLPQGLELQASGSQTWRRALCRVLVGAVTPRPGRASRPAGSPGISESRAAETFFPACFLSSAGSGQEARRSRKRRDALVAAARGPRPPPCCSGLGEHPSAGVSQEARCGRRRG